MPDRLYPTLKGGETMKFASIQELQGITRSGMVVFSERYFY